MNKEEILQTYKALRHEKQTEIRAINPETKEVKTFFISNDKLLPEICSTHDKKYNLYWGINERKEKGTKSEDVVYVKIIPVDIDCVNKPATSDDLLEAQNVCYKIINDGKKQGFQEPLVALSGNGFQIYFCLPGIKIEDNWQEIEEKIQEFERKLIEKYSTKRVRLDNVGDLARIMRIPGTYNLKSKTYSKLIWKDINEDSLLQDYILSISTKKIVVGGKLDDKISKTLQKDEKVWNLFNGDIKGFKSRSEAEQSLVCRLITLGLTKENIFVIMASCKIGKWQEANIQYRELTYKKALMIMTRGKENLEFDEKGVKGSIEEIIKYREEFKITYDLLIKILKKYLDLREEYYPILALWILGTYMHDGFLTYPYIFLNASKGSGKTRTLKLVAYLAHKGDLLVSMSEAVLFRTAKESTLCIDEIERIQSKDKSALRELLNAAYKKGISVKRTKKVKKRVEGEIVEDYEIENFDVFCPIVLANIWGLDDVLEDRCVSLILERSTNTQITKLLEAFDTDLDIKEAKNRLSDLLVYVSATLIDKIQYLYNLWNSYLLTNIHLHTHIHTTHNHTLLYTFFKRIDEGEIEGRHLELTFPLLILSFFIGDEVFDTFLKIVKTIILEKKTEDLVESNDVSFLDFISQQKYDPKCFVHVGDITNKFKEFMDETNSKKSWINPTWVGKALRRLNLIIKKRRVAKGKEVRINIEKAKEKVKIFIPKEPEPPKETKGQEKDQAELPIETMKIEEGEE